MSVYYHQDKTIFTEFPAITLAPLQNDIAIVIQNSNITTLMCSRRIGKTTAADVEFFNNAVPDLDIKLTESNLNNLPIMRHGVKFVCSHPIAQGLYEYFYSNSKGAFLHAFGGPKVFGSNGLDETYIKLPNRYYKWLVTDIAQRTTSEIKWFFGDEDKKQPSIITQFPIPELEGQLFIKLFKDNMDKGKSSKDSEGTYTATLFNGVTIELIAANSYFGKYVRGGTIDYIWGEEIGEWKTNYIEENAIQAVVNRKGKIVLTLTPPSTSSFPEPFNHWTYKQIIEPTLELDEFTKYKFTRGLNYYVSTRKQYKPVERMINGRKESTTKEVRTTNTIVIGKFSECYSYTHEGLDNLYETLGQLQEVVHAEEIFDEKTHIPIKNEIGVPLLKFIYTGKPFKSGGIDMDVWHREYEMSYAGVSKQKIFDKFTQQNVLPKDFIEYIKDKPRIIGFDKGMADVDVVNQKVIGAGSPTMALEFAYLGSDQWVILNERLMEYDKQVVGNYFLENAKKGIPLIYDRVMENTTDKSGSSRNNDIDDIIKLYPELSSRFNGGIYNKCLISGLKLSEQDRIKRLNQMFSLTEEINYAPHPLRPNQSGSRIYVTDNCVNTIKYFSSHSYQIDKNTKDCLLDKNNNRIPVSKVPNEPFDIASYVLDTFNGFNKSTGKSYRESIHNIWNNPIYKAVDDMKFQNKANNGYTIFNRPRFNVSKVPRYW